MTTDYYDVVGSFTTHALAFISGATGISIVAHAVNTFPQPKSEIGRWFLGVVQYAVGQRAKGLNTMNGRETIEAPLLKQEVQVIAAAPPPIVVVQGIQAVPDPPKKEH